MMTCIQAARRFIILVAVAGLCACGSTSVENNRPLVLGPDEVPLDQSFKIFMESDSGMNLNAMFFLAIKNSPTNRLICSAFYFSKSRTVTDISHVDLTGETTNFVFDSTNSVIQQTERGEPFNFVYPNHKAKCAVEPKGYTLLLKKPMLEVHMQQNDIAIPIKLGLSLDLQTLKSITAK